MPAKAKKPLTRTATQKDVCDTLDISPRTVRNWMGKGMPVSRGGPGKPNHFNLKEIAAWMREVGLTGEVAPPIRPGTPPKDSPQADALTAAKLRRELAGARKLELAVEKIEGSLVGRGEADERITRICAALVALHDGIPAKLAPLLTPLEDEVEVEQAIREALEEIRRMIADPEAGK